MQHRFVHILHWRNLYVMALVAAAPDSVRVSAAIAVAPRVATRAAVSAHRLAERAARRVQRPVALAVSVSGLRRQRLRPERFVWSVRSAHVAGRLSAARRRVGGPRAHRQRGLLTIGLAHRRLATRIVGHEARCGELVH